LVSFDDGIIRANLLNISLKGALVEFVDRVSFQLGDILNITFELNDLDIALQFRSKVMHYRYNIVGVKFIQIDLDTMIPLCIFIEARSMDLEQVVKEFEYL
jgi:hypothetical protein